MLSLQKKELLNNLKTSKQKHAMKYLNNVLSAESSINLIEVHTVVLNGKERNDAQQDPMNRIMSPHMSNSKFS